MPKAAAQWDLPIRACRAALYLHPVAQIRRPSAVYSDDELSVVLSAVLPLSQLHLLPSASQSRFKTELDEPEMFR